MFKKIKNVKKKIYPHTLILTFTLNFSNGSKIFHFTIGNSALKGNALRKDNRGGCHFP